MTVAGSHPAAITSDIAATIAITEGCTCMGAFAIEEPKRRRGFAWYHTLIVTKRS